MAFDRLEERPGWTAHVEKRLSWRMALLVIGAFSLVGWAVLIFIIAELLRLSSAYL